MARKRKKSVLSRVIEEDIAEIILQEVREEGLRVYPSTQSEVNKILRKARLKSGEAAIVAAALISAAVEEAQRSNVRTVRVKHLESAWTERLSLLGNCPPHKCLFVSILQRQEALKEKMPLFGEISASLKGLL